VPIPKTVGNHIEHVSVTIGRSRRAEVGLFAV